MKAAIFSPSGWAYHTGWSVCCLCVLVLTRVASIMTAIHRDL